jgi:hypothetical protein
MIALLLPVRFHLHPELLHPSFVPGRAPDHLPHCVADCLYHFAVQYSISTGAIQQTEIHSLAEPASWRAACPV